MTTTLVRIRAEDAPLGVQITPTDPDRHAGTLREVAAVRGLAGPHIRWTFADGSMCVFEPGERVPCQLDLTQLRTRAAT